MRAFKIDHAGVFALVLVLGLPGLAAGFEKSVPSQGLTAVAVHTLSGQVDLIGWDKPEVLVQWTEDAIDQQPHIGAEGGRLRIGGDPKKDHGLTADLKVHLPRGLKVEVKTISGDLTATALSAGGRLTSISGEVKATGVSGGLTIKTVSGDVDLRDVTGDLEIKSVSGEIDLIEVNSPLLEVKTVSGDIDLRGPLGKVRATSHSGEVRLTGSLMAGAGLRVKSFSGDLKVVLPADAGFDLDASTRSGDVRVDFPLLGSEISGTRASGRVGQGGAELELSSFSGDVRVLKGN